MSRLVKISGVCALLLALNGCSYLYGNHGFIKNRDTDYLHAQSIAPLKIPDGYASNGFHSEFPIPNRSYTPEQENVKLTPPELYAN